MEKMNSRTQVIIAIIGLLGITIGTFGTMLVNFLNAPEPKPIDFSVSKVQKYDGVFVFIRSRPKENYTSLGIVESNTAVRAAESGTGKKGWDILNNVGKSLLKDISFENRLSSIVTEAKKEKAGVEGLIFIDDLNKCEAIKFK